MLVRVETPRRPRRWPWLVGAIGATVLVVAGAVALVGGDTGGYSLEAAIEGAGDHDSVTSELDADLAMMKMTATGQTDLVDQRASVEADLGVGAMSMVVDLAEGVVYVQADAFGLGSLPRGAEWIRFSASDLEALGLGRGELPGGLGAAGHLGPLFDALGDATEVHEGEIETLDDVDGVRAKHYTVTVDVERLADGLSLPFDVLRLGRATLLPPTVAVDVWVDRDDLIRRVAVELGVGRMGIDLVVRFPSWDEDLDIELPDPATVVDAGDLPGMFG